MSVGLIINPRAGKESGHGLKLAKLLAARGADKKGVVVKIIEDFGALESMMDDFAAREITTLFISSGDGTVQAIQTDIAERKKFNAQPALCLLPHGTTNMTAADLGFSIKSIEGQADFVMALGGGALPSDVRKRPTVRVANPRDGKARHGMFVGTGAAWQGTKFCQTDVHKTGLKGDWATFATLATALFKGAFFRANPSDLTRIDRAYEMEISGDGEDKAKGDQLLYLATTLQKLILGVKPFWGGADGPLRSSIIAYPPPNLFRWTLPILRGGEDRKVPDGAQSFCADVVLIKTQCPFVIDGEFFEPPVDEPLKIETGPEFSYVCG